MSNNKWQALSMRDRAFLIREAVRNGITDINSIRNLYNERGEKIRLGVPYKTFEAGSDYDYYNAAPENMPQENDGHWSSRNPHTGQLLKAPNHPTYNLLLEGEKQSNYHIEKIGDREYSFPAEHKFSGEEDTGVWDKISSLFTTKKPVDNRKTAGPVDLEEIKIRQAWAESRFNDSAKSPAGAMGRFQIMPAVQQDYIKATGKKGSLTNRKYNEAVRDWMMEESLANREWITKGNATDSVKMGKQLAAYNLGPTSALRALQKAKNAGIDIYDSFDWLSPKYFPKETVDYVQWILRGKPTGSHRNNEVFEKNRHLYTK